MIRKYAIIITAVFLLSLLVAAYKSPQLFVTSHSCQSCHNGLATPLGEDVSIGVDWRSSMMAHSSRDPYWQAAVRRETLVHPSAEAVIEDECSACHMPMARYSANAAGEKGTIFGHLPIVRAATHMDQLAADGVSCSMCHQIRKDKLGERESFTAGFVVDSETALGEREIFGPHDVDEGRKSLMKSASLFIPYQAEHIQSSELCASCHTLITHALDDDGEVIGEFPEQVPYLEWKHSSYSGSRSCQSCHMPEVEGKMMISGVLGKDREQFSRHVFRGGNFLMPRILNGNRHELGVAALPQELDTTARRTTEHLETSSAKIDILDAKVADGRLRVEVRIKNLAGHKLPSAYPSRRTWIRFAVHDEQDNLIFESGRINPDGSIAGNDNDRDKHLFEPHFEEISSAEDVQIYEPIMAGPDGKVTTVLLSAIRYLKDNRLLPDGFVKETAEEDCAVHGEARHDGDFQGGGDRIVYAVPVPAGKGPFMVRAALWHQPIGYRWAHNLEDQDAAEISRFVSYFNAFSASSAMALASTEITIRIR